MKWFDANCCIGRLAVPLPQSIDSAAELAEVMTRAGVDEALAYHSYAKEYHPAEGNQQLLEELRDYPNLHPCWTLLPHQTGELPPAEELVAEMIRSGVRAARVFPRTHNWTLSEWSAGDLLMALEAQAVPLFLDIEEADFGQIHSLCNEHPRLPVVLTRAPFRLSRQIYALLATTSNLQIEMSCFQLHGGIEDMCARFGAGRLLFGSAAPHFAPAPSVMAVRYAAISEDERAMIAGGNLQRLLRATAGRGGGK